MANAKAKHQAQPGATDRFSTMVAAYWRGEMPLWSAFWVWGMGVGTLVGICMTLLSLTLMSMIMQLWGGDGAQTFLAILFTYIVVLLFGFWLTYYTWHVVSVWRCAEQAAPLMRWSVRVFVLGVTVTFFPIFLATSVFNFF